MPFERAEGRLLRSFTLPGLDGAPLDTFRYRGSQSLIILFHDGASCVECADLLRALAADSARIEAEGAQMISVSVGDSPADRELAEAIDPQVITLFDPQRKANMAQGFGVPALVITDRYGEIFALWRPDAEQGLPTAEDVYGWLVWIEAQCAACTTVNWAKVGEA